METEFHPIADIFPLLQGEELARLVESVRRHGLEVPIILHSDGRIVDGRNRYRACIQAGVEPRFKTWDGEGSLVGRVCALNLDRRHLDSSQCAACAVEALPFYEAEARDRQREGGAVGGRGDRKLPQKVAEASGESVELAAREFGTNKQYVKEAKKIKDEDPEAFEAIKSGEKTIPKS